MIKGSLQVNNGTYYVSFRVADKNGEVKQRMRSTGIKAVKGNKRKAEQRMQEILEQLDGIASITDNALLCDYIADWIERDKSRVQITTYDGYKHMLNKYIYPYFKNTRLKVQDVKPMHIEKYCAEKINGGLEANTVLKHLAIIRTALQDAVKNGVIRTNPADLAEKPKRVKPKHDYYTTEELRTLWNVAQNTSLELPIYFAMFFGLRRSECVGMKWSAIDFDNKILTVCNKVTRGKVDGKIVPVESDTLKTEASERQYVLNEWHINYLKSVKENQNKMCRSTQKFVDFVCVNEVGELVNLDYITSKFSKILKQHGLRHIRFHDLRHSCITLLANDSSFTMKQVQEYAGHADYLTTANIYSHVDSKHKLNELNALTNQLLL